MFERIKLQLAFSMMKKKRKSYQGLPVTGIRSKLNRGQKEPVDYILYQPECQKTKLPLFVELHGGGWVAGDAALVDSFSRKIADETPAVVVSLNYQKLDMHPFPYPQEELCDLLSYFIQHAEEYDIDMDKIVICGQSAGAHICAGAAVMAKDRGIKIANQILVYPYVDFTGSVPGLSDNAQQSKQTTLKLIRKRFFKKITISHPYVSPLIQDIDVLEKVAPAVIIVCGIDDLRPHALAYDKKLKESGVSSILKEYPKAMHGFLEVNRPDFLDDHPAKSPAQKGYTRDCENFIIACVRDLST